MMIKYDTPFEVSEKQYNLLMSKCDGWVAGREDGGKFFIKVWLMKQVEYIKRIAGL